VDTAFLNQIANRAKVSESFQSEHLTVSAEQVNLLVAKTQCILTDLCHSEKNQLLPRSLQLFYQCSPLAKGMLMFLAYQQLSIELSAAEDLAKSINSLNEGSPANKFNSDILFPLYHHVVLNALSPEYKSIFAEVRFVHRYRRASAIWNGEPGWGLTNFCSAIQHIADSLSPAPKTNVFDASTSNLFVNTIDLDLSGQTDRVVIGDLPVSANSKPLPSLGGGLYAIVGGLARTFGVDGSPTKTQPTVPEKDTQRPVPVPSKSISMFQNLLEPKDAVPGLNPHLLAVKSFRDLSIADVEQLLDCYQKLAKWVASNNKNNSK
jgi:hypothetical protein